MAGSEGSTASWKVKVPDKVQGKVPQNKVFSLLGIWSQQILLALWLVKFPSKRIARKGKNGCWFGHSHLLVIHLQLQRYLACYNLLIRFWRIFRLETSPQNESTSDIVVTNLGNVCTSPKHGLLWKNATLMVIIRIGCLPFKSDRKKPALTFSDDGSFISWDKCVSL